MAEKLVRVCDVCGETPADAVRITANGKNREKDLCSKHLAELMKGSRAPRRGRRRGSPGAVAANRRGRRPKASGP